MTREQFERAVETRWPAVRRELNYPVIGQVHLVGGEDEHGEIDERADSVADRGAYRWERNEIAVSLPFLRAVHDGGDPGRVVETVLKHEAGHYVCFPRELARHLQYLQRATEAFGAERGERVYALYADVCNELRLLENGVVGDDVLELHRRTLDAVDGPGSVSTGAHRRFTRLVLALYAALFDDLSSNVSLDGDERVYLDRLRDIDYFTEDVAVHERNLVRFGHVLDDAISDLPGTLEGDPPMDAGKSPADRAFPADLDAVSRSDLDDALSETVQQGQWEYERLASFLETRATEFDDQFDDAAGGAGIDHAGLDTHDDQIAFYRRWASTFPLYVADAPVTTDGDTRYRSGRKPYEIGDPLETIDPFASQGVLGVPGVSQVYRRDAARVTREEYRVPDLLVGIDSSGSMPLPDDESYAVLAAFVLANTYSRNGANVGGYNFAADLAYLPPSRDPTKFYSLVCARWGGGTVLNWRALVTFLQDDETDDEPVLRTSGSEAHESLLEDVRARDQKAAGSELAAADVTALPDELGRVDHVLITDGDVVNEREVLEYVARIGENARNFVFLTDEAAYEHWRTLDVPNTEVYLASDQSDLAGLAVGLAQSVTADGTTD